MYTIYTVYVNIHMYDMDIKLVLNMDVYIYEYAAYVGHGYATYIGYEYACIGYEYEAYIGYGYAACI